MKRAAMFAAQLFVCAGLAGVPALASVRTVTQPLPSNMPSVATEFADQPECKVKSVRKAETTFENVALAPKTNLLAFTLLDAKGVYQVYLAKADGTARRCITCAAHRGAPRPDRNKPMLSWHPSGQWLIVGVEEDTHDLMWLPASWQRGLLQSGIWLNMWVVSASGEDWRQLTDYKNNGFVGVSFTPDGKQAVWAEIIDGNVFANHFGVWRLIRGDFIIAANEMPTISNRRDITPAGARWVEPGNFSPDGREILLSADIGLSDAQGQDQWALDFGTGRLRNLTNSPAVWDEHGLFSGDGRKISFMSSYPYQHEVDSYQAASLRTEFMLMDADGSHLQQLTHFNVPGYPESQGKNTIAAVAGFFGDGSQLFATVMSADFGKTNWTITFAGRCGSRRAF